MMNSRPTKKPESRGPFKNLRKGASRILSSKYVLALISFLAALVTWGILVASDGTLTREKIIENAPLNVNGEATLRSRGYIVMDDIKGLVPGVRMTVEISQNNYSRVSGASYNPHVDLADVTGVGENELKIEFGSSAYGGRVTSSSPETVVVNVERYVTRRVPVLLLTSGQTPEGIYMDSAKSDPSSLSVSGPQSVVSRIARVVATIDLSQLSAERMTDRIVAPIELQTTAGEVVLSDKVQVTNQSVITDSVIVEIELMPMKDVPLILEQFAEGTPAQGYELIGVEASQESIPVAARQEVLDALEYFTTESPLDITGAMEDVTGTVRLKRPSGMENTVPYDVNVTAKIREKQIERTLYAIDVEVVGVDDSFATALSRRQLTVQLMGGYHFISGLKKEDVRLFVDAQGLEAGEHTLPVQIHIDNAPEFTCALSAPEITVTLTEK